MSWTLRTADLDDLARGAALLGTGGGGRSVRRQDVGHAGAR